MRQQESELSMGLLGGGGGGLAAAASDVQAIRQLHRLVEHARDEFGPDDSRYTGVLQRYGAAVQAAASGAMGAHILDIELDEMAVPGVGANVAPGGAGVPGAGVPIEFRAVSAAALRHFTDTRVLSDKALVGLASVDAIKRLEKKILEKEEIVDGSAGGVDFRQTANFETKAHRDLRMWKHDLEKRKRTPYMTSRDVLKYIIKKDTVDLLCRYVELPGWAQQTDADGHPFVGRADYMVSHCHDGPWLDIVEGVEVHQATQDRVCYYWVDLLAVCQHPIDGKTEAEIRAEAARKGNTEAEVLAALENDKDLKGLGDVIDAAGMGTLVLMEPWDQPRAPTRTWCVYEMDRALQRDVSVQAIMGRVEKRRMQLSLEDHFSDIQKTINAIDLKLAECTRIEDQERIMHGNGTTAFPGVRNSEGGIDGVNQAVREFLCCWLADAADYVADRTDPHREQLSEAELHLEDAELGDSRGLAAVSEVCLSNSGRSTPSRCLLQHSTTHARSVLIAIGLFGLFAGRSSHRSAIR